MQERRCAGKGWPPSDASSTKRRGHLAPKRRLSASSGATAARAVRYPLVTSPSGEASNEDF